MAGGGDADPGKLRCSVESIDISEAGRTGLLDLNRDVFASNPVVTADMRQLLQRGQRPPGTRAPGLGVRQAKHAAGSYWYYKRT